MIRPPIDKTRTPEMQRFFDDLSREASDLLSRIEDLEDLDYATEAEAEAGTATDKLMSPARTYDAILALSPFVKFAHYQNQQADGTAGGGFSSGSWVTRVLNTEVYDNIGISLNTNEITVPAGTYFIDATAPAFSCRANQLRLYDATNAAVVLYGLTEHAADGADGNSSSTAIAKVRGRFVTAGAVALRLEHRCAQTQNTDGLGRASSFGNIEVYADLLIYKLD